MRKAHSSTTGPELGSSYALVHRLALPFALMLGYPIQAADFCSEARLREAFEFAFPVYQMAFTRQGATQRVAANGGELENAIRHRTSLSDHTHRNVTTPNNDTLYSSSWVDLSSGPVLLHLPPASQRYVSVALLDMFTDNFAILHPEDANTEGHAWIVGPDWHGVAPTDAPLIRSPMNDAWLIARTFVDGPSDLEAARAVQSEIRIVEPAPPVRHFNETVEALADPQTFLNVVNSVLGRGPLPPTHANRIHRFECAGVSPGSDDGWRALPKETRLLWKSSFANFYDRLRSGLQDAGSIRNGWSYPAPGMGDFGTDDLYRSRIAVGGLGALPSSEAFYLSSRSDSEGRSLDGRHRYTLRIPAGVPARAFWSVSLYEIASDGRLFFAANAIGRYAINSSNRSLRRQKDGSAIILIQSSAPEKGADANWLPAPKGTFALTFRAYRPYSAQSATAFELPPVRRR